MIRNGKSECGRRALLLAVVSSSPPSLQNSRSFGAGSEHKQKESVYFLGARNSKLLSQMETKAGALLSDKISVGHGIIFYCFVLCFTEKWIVIGSFCNIPDSILSPLMPAKSVDVRDKLSGIKGQ